jgi:sulfite reductase beta subunit
MGYNPDKPMDGRISDLGPPHYEQFFPPVIKANKGKWLWHEITQPGVLMHKSETGDEVYTVRVGSPRLVSVEYIREVCDIAISTVMASSASLPGTTSSSWSMPKKRFSL